MNAVSGTDSGEERFFEWDGQKVEYPYLVLMSIWDQRSQDHSASPEYGRLVVPPGLTIVT